MKNKKNLITKVLLIGSFVVMLSSCGSQNNSANLTEEQQEEGTTVYFVDPATGELKAENNLGASLVTINTAQYDCVDKYEFKFNGVSNTTTAAICQETDSGVAPMEYGKFVSCEFKKGGVWKNCDTEYFDKQDRTTTNLKEYSCQKIDNKPVVCSKPIPCPNGFEIANNLTRCKAAVAVSDASWTAMTQGIRNLNTNYVGIGKTTPTQKLDIQGNMIIDGALKIGACDAATMTACTGGTANGAICSQGGVMKGCVGNKWVDLVK